MLGAVHTIYMTKTTATLTSMHGTARMLAEQNNITVTELGSNAYTISFNDVDAAIAAIDNAKAQAWSAYLNQGGNPRNKRSFSSQFASTKKAVNAAS